jgi:WD40 repeat protein
VVFIPNCHKANYVYSALILFGKGNDPNCILTTAPNEYTKVWNLKDGSFIRNIGTLTDYTYYINSWYDPVNKETYIINANAQDIKLYNYKTGNLYKAYKAQIQTWHMSAFIHTVNEVPYIFETDGNGYIRLWDVHAGTIYKSMHIKGCSFRGMSLWNDKYLIVASSDKSFKIFDFLNAELKDSIACHDNVLCTVEKLLDPIYGETLLTTSIDGKLKLWTK